MKVFTVVLLITVALTSDSLASAVSTEVIKYAAVIFRHGDRTPVDMYPTDPWKNESFWPVKFGQLTNKGKQQHYALGQWLRKRYSHLLSKKFDPTELHVISTDVDRTLMSVQANLAGMYPPVGTSIWNKALLWQPIPIHTKPEATDEVLAMKKKCKAYNEEMEHMKQSKSYKEKLSLYQALMDYMSAYTGRKIKDYYDIEDIYSNLYIESLYNFTLPNWTHSIYPNKMREPACYSFATSAATPLLARLRAGPLLKDIMTKLVMSTSTKTKERLKVSMYSGHDFTIGTLLTALGMFDGNCPVYTATIFIELVGDSTSESQFIRISYRNSTEIVEPYVLSIPYCGKLCSMERFIKLYKNLLTVDFDRDCGKEVTTMFGASFVIGLTILVTVYVVHRIKVMNLITQQRLMQKSIEGYSNIPVNSEKPAYNI